MQPRSVLRGERAQGTPRARRDALRRPHGAPRRRARPCTMDRVEVAKPRGTGVVPPPPDRGESVSGEHEEEDC